MKYLIIGLAFLLTGCASWKIIPHGPVKAQLYIVEDGMAWHFWNSTVEIYSSEDQRGYVWIKVRSEEIRIKQPRDLTVTIAPRP